MKKILFLILMLLNSFTYASTRHLCKYKKFDISVVTDKESDIFLEIFRGKTKVSSCLFKVVSFNDGKMSQSTDEQIRFEKVNCNLVYDKIASDVDIIERGFIKSSMGTSSSFIYVIKNEQPLNCNIKK